MWLLIPEVGVRLAGLGFGVMGVEALQGCGALPLVPAPSPTIPAISSPRCLGGCRWARDSRGAGWFLLLGLAAGASGAGLDAGVAQMLTDRGWRTHGSSAVSAAQAHRGARTTLEALESMAGGVKALDPALLTRLARATLFGLTKAA